MNALTITLTLLQPLLIGQLGAGEENSAISFNYIAGSTIRGALIGRYMERNGVEIDLTDQAMRRLFFTNDVSYLNSYPQDETGNRTLPTPRSWRVESEEVPIEIMPNDVIEITDTAVVDIAEMAEPESISDPFCSVQEDGTTLYTPKRHTGLHNASTERYIKQENDSFVFRYDALAAGQTFCGVIISEDQTLLKTLSALLDQPDLFLGRSRSAGYGHTKISAVELVTDWHEYPLPALDNAPEKAPEKLTLTLLSDAILRDANGQYTVDLLKSQPFSQLEHSTIEVSTAFTAIGFTGGFNRKWGLPLPQVPIIKAGSVWTFRHSAPLEKALQVLVATRVGERTLDGFGRVALNWQQHSHLEKRAPKVDAKPAIVVTLGGTAQTLAARMVERLYRQALDQRLMQHVAGSLAIGGTLPENTQLSRLRLIVRRAWRNPELGMTLIKNFLQKLKPTAKNQYLRAQIDRQSLLQWLEEGWQDDKLWKTYFYISSTDLPQIGDVQAQESAELKLEYTVRLVDALCNKTIRSQQAEQQTQQATRQRAEVTS